MSPARAFATVGGLGYLRPAPGTWGSLAALPLAWALVHFGGIVWFSIALILVIPLGVIATERATRGTGDHDPSEIVIDEVAGQWIALIPVTYGATFTQSEPLDLWPGWIAAFVLFRLFDIWKPGPIGAADRRADPVGTMLDDLIAGAFAAIGVIALALLAHGLAR